LKAGFRRIGWQVNPRRQFSPPLRLMPVERHPEIESVAPTGECWLVGSKPRDDRRLAGVFRDEAFSPPGRQRSQDYNHPTIPQFF
jgi:hypothetical protein